MVVVVGGGSLLFCPVVRPNRKGSKSSPSANRQSWESQGVSAAAEQPKRREATQASQARRHLPQAQHGGSLFPSSGGDGSDHPRPPPVRGGRRARWGRASRRGGCGGVVRWGAEIRPSGVRGDPGRAAPAAPPGVALAPGLPGGRRGPAAPRLARERGWGRPRPPAAGSCRQKRRARGSGQAGWQAPLGSSSPLRPVVLSWMKSIEVLLARGFGSGGRRAEAASCTATP